MAGVLLLCLCIGAVSAAGEVIEQGATVFIGEQDLNITHALNDGYGYSDPDGDPAPATIGLFTLSPPLQGFAEDTPPGAYNVTLYYRDFLVSPASYVGYTGNWWAVKPGAAGSDHMGDTSPAFIVADPSLRLTIWDAESSTNITEATVPQGTRIRFKISTNMYPAVDPAYRSPINPATDGYIDIRVRDPGSAVLTQVYNDNIGVPGAGPNSLQDNFVDTGDWDWGGGSPSYFEWDTGAVDGGNSFLYQPGTYEVWAESALHGMKDNYKDAGADYEGKTVTSRVHITLTPAASPGAIAVNSVPEGSWIQLDGEGILLTTNTTLLGVSPGVHRVTIGNPGYYNTSRNVTVTSGATSTVEFAMDPVPVTFDSEAQISVQKVITEELGDDTTGKLVSALPDTIHYAPDGSGKPTVNLWAGGTVPFTSDDLDDCSLVAVDQAPEANWEHPVTYYCVDSDGDDADPYDGAVMEKHTAFTPATNYLFEAASGDVPSPGEDWEPDDPYVWRQTCVNDCSNNYALLISGGNDMNTNYRRYWNDIAFMYINLIEYGYAPSHITVLMADGSDAANDRCIAGYPVCTAWDSSPQDLNGDTVNEVIQPATKASITSTLDSMKTSLPAGSNLLVFTTAHGGNDTVPGSNNARIYTWYGSNPTPENQYITDDDFIGYLNSLTQLNSITLIMENCYSGGFHDEFITGTQKRVIMTATNGDESSWGNGFSDAVTTAMAGHTRYFTSTCNPDNPTDVCRAQMNKNADEPSANPDGSANGDQRVSAKEAFYYAKALDPYATTTAGPVPGKEHPTLSSTPSTDLVTQFISACTASAAKSLSVQNPAVNARWPAGQKHVITWTAKGLADKNVKITLYKGTTLQTPNIADSVPADRGYYEWPIPSTQAAATNYKVKVEALAVSPAVSGTSSTFTIQAVPASNTGKLTIKAKDESGNPLAATVYVDESTGYCSTKTPCTTSPLTGGDHNVTLILDGYYRFSTFVTVNAGSTITKTYTLMLIPTGQNADLPPFGGLDVSSSPGNAEIWLGRTGTTPSDTETTTPTVLFLEPGDYDVYVTKDGYQTPAAQTVRVERLTSTRVPEKVHFTLSPASGRRAVFRGANCSRNWFFDDNMDGVVDREDKFGMIGDIPLVGDMNNDGIMDRAVFRGVTSGNNWFIDYSMDGTTDVQNRFGRIGDIPLVSDMNNDGSMDRAVFRGLASGKNWFIDYSMDGTTDVQNRFGKAGDVPIVGDMNNDGMMDRAVFRGVTSGNNWFIDYSMDGTTDVQNRFGKAGDIPLLGDVDGDGITDRTVFRGLAGGDNWFIDYGMDGTTDVQDRFGRIGDLPVIWRL